ncbi:hypothetical protein DFQ30_007172 [Apophysomyces sp. BC1015]|nr:hypothetical protein DFQ30_007172 [Apophysomyces sp. BC1015]
MSTFMSFSPATMDIPTESAEMTLPQENKILDMVERRALDLSNSEKSEMASEGRKDHLAFLTIHFAEANSQKNRTLQQALLEKIEDLKSVIKVIKDAQEHFVAKVAAPTSPSRIQIVPIDLPLLYWSDNIWDRNTKVYDTIADCLKKFEDIVYSHSQSMDQVWHRCLPLIISPEQRSWFDAHLAMQTHLTWNQMKQLINIRTHRGECKRTDADDDRAMAYVYLKTLVAKLSLLARRVVNNQEGGLSQEQRQLSKYHVPTSATTSRNPASSGDASITRATIRPPIVSEIFGGCKMDNS